MTLHLIIDNTYAEIEAALAPVVHNDQPMIDARALHGWLGVGDPFSQWFKRRSREYGLEDGADFLPHAADARPEVLTSN